MEITDTTFQVGFTLSQMLIVRVIICNNNCKKKTSTRLQLTKIVLFLYPMNILKYLEKFQENSFKNSF